MKTLKFFAVRDLAKRLAGAADRNRYDQVTRVMHEIYEKKLEKDPSQLISNADFKNTFSTIATLNVESNFKELFDDILAEEDGKSGSISGDSPFKLSGYDGDDFRPTPISHEETLGEKIMKSSLKPLQRVASAVTVNPQYHYVSFLKVAAAGKDSGVALWTISFNTGKGDAKINVPIRVTAGESFEPEIFYTVDSKLPKPFTSQEIKNYIKNFNASTGQSRTETSGFGNIGSISALTDRHDIKEGKTYTEDDNFIYTDLGSDLTDESLVSSVSSVGINDSKLMGTVETARAYAASKVNSGASNIQLNFGGVSVTENNTIIAFNASLNTRNGKKIITIPVVVANDELIADNFYSTNGQHDLTIDALNKFIASENTIDTEESEVDAFSEAFLSTNASFDQLIQELKTSVYKNDFLRAKSCLTAIERKFGSAKLGVAAVQFQQFTKEALERKPNNLSDLAQSNSMFVG
jgi:hypothetical protein